VGFAAETEKLIDNARAKLKSKGCDWVVANDVSPVSGVFGGALNTVHLVTERGVESWPPQSKQSVADSLVRRIADQLGGARK
jgi:phosphopantothenoylcysteine decarboxylase/phosphopantothenate--cysteine ligase